MPVSVSPGQAGRIISLAGVTLLLVLFIHIYRASESPSSFNGSSKFIRPKQGGSLKGIDPLLNDIQPPTGGKLWGPGEREHANATLLMLVRNSELKDALGSIGDLERTWNQKFKYPWTFINDEPFSEEFKAATTAAVAGEARYEIIPKEHWEVPAWINKDLMDASADYLTDQKVQYSKMVSYHQMCRWNSGMFYKHPALQKIKWYWRVEPKVNFYCDIDYDVFWYMEDFNKTYGFTINLYDSPESITSLWPTTLEFLAEHPDYMHKNNALKWLTDAKNRPEHNQKAGGYSTCHFWSNFEIADMDFWRSKEYEEYFEHLDRAGGFFYERWGDAPVHSIGLGLFADRDKIHWFKDIGYRHAPYFNCPSSPKCKGCEAGRFTFGADVEQEDCRVNWFEYVGLD
ncbi:glycosyl transferase [Ascobolus immersus RN42]|uniref:Glycosyl transferase n=1 Tax=Ascobolus immersus RN42 TaxID=1160509 RepID=A0A3N4IPW6_ASCIM|nr:glycosyl transferase [Ascobolus immersus RN42]